MFYAQSWALTHWMIAGDEKPGARLSELLTRLKKGEGLATAFQAAAGMSIEAVEKELEKYVRQSSFAYYSFSFDEALTTEALEAAPMSRVETLYRLGDLLAHVAPIQYGAAEAHIAAALALEPAHPGALLTRAWLDRTRKRWDQAAVSYEAALAKGGSRAARGYGLMLLERMETELSQDLTEHGVPAQALRARELFRQALVQSPDDPVALAGFGETFLFGDTEVAEGMAALTRAYEGMASRPELLVEWIVLAARLSETCAPPEKASARTGPVPSGRGAVAKAAAAPRGARRPMPAVGSVGRDDDPPAVSIGNIVEPEKVMRAPTNQRGEALARHGRRLHVARLLSRDNAEELVAGSLGLEASGRPADEFG